MSTNSAPAAGPLRAIVYSSPLGPGWVSFDFESGRLIGCGLPGSKISMAVVDDGPHEAMELVASLEGYWRGGSLPPLSSIDLDAASRTDLDRRIYEAVATIPAGSTRTYAEVARRVNRPGAARAVGAAMAANRFAPVIPCHRVVGSDGRLRGYAGGLEMKRFLLEMEGNHRA